MSDRDLSPPLAGVLLAGGLSRRMGGGDKALLEIGGETILSRMIARVMPQVAGRWRSTLTAPTT